MFRKNITKAQFETLARSAASSHLALVELWRDGMKALPVKSTPYQLICGMGDKSTDLILKLRDQAMDRGYSQAEIQEMFGDSIRVGTSFS
jgi:hypothetical protein